MTNDTAADVLQSYLDALVSGDLDRIRAHFAADATWTIHGSLPLAGTYEGADAIMEFLATATRDLFVPGTHALSFGRMHADGDTVVLEWHVTGVGAATNLPYDNDCCGIFVIRDQLVQSVREFFDTDHVREVLYAGERRVLVS